jgi:hypothetical protein
MEITYTVRGADGKEYGPVNLDQITGWIHEGRLQPQQEVRRSDVDYWVPAGDYTELKSLFGPATSTAGNIPPALPSGPRPLASGQKTDPALAATLKSGASWFYWIAGLSLVNSISAASGSGWRFLLGLGITQVVDAFGSGIGGSGKIVALVLNLLVASMFVALGIFGNKRHLWAFIVGMGLFALDGLIFLLDQDWLGVGFHVFALYCLFRGFSACRQMGKTHLES